MIGPILMCVQMHHLIERCNQVQKCVLHDYIFVLWLNLCIGHYSFSHWWTWYLSCQNSRCRPKPSRCLLPFVVELLILSLFLCHENNIGTYQDHPSWIIFPCTHSFAKRKCYTLCFVVWEIKDGTPGLSFWRQVYIINTLIILYQFKISNWLFS